MLIQRRLLLSVLKHCTMKRSAADSCQNAAAALEQVSNSTTEASSQEPVESSEVAVTRVKRTKPARYALLLSFCGRDYYGMQTTTKPEYPTIESTLLGTFAELGLHSSDDCRNPGKFKFQRAARTDKGVSAVRQIVSCNLSLENKDEETLQKCKDGLNQLLPEVIRVMGMKRVTKNFDARWLADGRSYSYTLPTFAFAHLDELTDESFRISAERIDEINDILSIFRGSHNFCNFSSGRKFTDASCLRYINEATCGEPFERSGIEFVVVSLKGQSFILHQIRKMMAVVISIVRGFVNKSILQKAFDEAFVRLPIAPGLGLLLERVQYSVYDKKFEKTHPSITFWPECEDAIVEFKEKYISSIVYETEQKQKSMLEWLKLLHVHYSADNNGRDIAGVDFSDDVDVEAEDSEDKNEELESRDDLEPPLKKAALN